MSHKCMQLGVFDVCALPPNHLSSWVSTVSTPCHAPPGQLFTVCAARATWPACPASRTGPHPSNPTATWERSCAKHEDSAEPPDLQTRHVPPKKAPNRKTCGDPQRPPGAAARRARARASRDASRRFRGLKGTEQKAACGPCWAKAEPKPGGEVKRSGVDAKPKKGTVSFIADPGFWMDSAVAKRIKKKKRDAPPTGCGPNVSVTSLTALGQSSGGVSH